MSHEQAPVPDREVEEAAAQMQQVPLPLEPAPKRGCGAGEEEQGEAGGGGVGSEAPPGGGPADEAPAAEDAAAEDAVAGSLGTQRQRQAAEAAVEERAQRASAGLSPAPASAGNSARAYLQR